MKEIQFLKSPAVGQTDEDAIVSPSRGQTLGHAAAAVALPALCDHLLELLLATWLATLAVASCFLRPATARLRRLRSLAVACWCGNVC